MSTSIDKPSPDITEIERGISALFEPTDIIEVRVPKANGNKGTIAGTFCASSPELAKTIANLSGQHPNIYYTLNPIASFVHVDGGHSTERNLGSRRQTSGSSCCLASMDARRILSLFHRRTCDSGLNQFMAPQRYSRPISG